MVTMMGRAGRSAVMGTPMGFAKVAESTLTPGKGLITETARLADVLSIVSTSALGRTTVRPERVVLPVVAAAGTLSNRVHTASYATTLVLDG
jgi:hypothetical protein